MHGLWSNPTFAFAVNLAGECGDRVLTFTATDACGNVSTCRFTVRVGADAAVSIERAVLVRWTCPGTLESADDPAGSGTEVVGATSPYCAVAEMAKKYYRVK